MKNIYFVSVLLLILMGSLINMGTLYAQNSQTQDMASELYETAKRYEKEGNLDEALEYYQKAFETSKHMPFKKMMLKLIGEVYTRMERYEEALQIYRKYLELASNPFEEVRGQRKIAYIYVDQEKYPEGFKILDEIIEEYKGKYPEGRKEPYPFAADAQFSKAAIYHNFMKDYEKAISEYQKMIEEFPDDWRVKKSPYASMNMASCYGELKRYDEAIEIYQEIIANYPNTDFAKAAELSIEFTNEYGRKGIEPSPEVIKRKMEEKGLPIR